MQKLLQEISQCVVCENYLDAGCRPVLSASPKSKIVIIGQALGRKVHDSGIHRDDESGENLRNWLGISKEAFYDPNIFALIPMGFCYPRTGKSGDLPRRPECAPPWHHKLWQEMEDVKLTLLFGQYA
jgi:uracil-DNA glycosylase